MPYRVQKPYVIVGGQKLVSPTALPQRLPCCARCGELAAASENLYTELAVDRWWKWFSYPKFACQEEAFMGCEKHPVEPEIRFLDGRIERYTRLPPTRWQQMTEPVPLFVALVFAVVFAVVSALVFK